MTFIYTYGSGVTGDDIDTVMDEGKAYYELPPYKIYALPPFGSRYLIYSENEYGPTNRDTEEPSIFPIVAFSELNPPLWKPGIFVSDDWPADNGDQYNGIIEYRERYFILNLTPSWGKTYRLSVDFTDENAVCSWRPRSSSE